MRQFLWRIAHSLGQLKGTIDLTAATGGRTTSLLIGRLSFRRALCQCYAGIALTDGIPHRLVIL
jgi:hypothetical protein